MLYLQHGGLKKPHAVALPTSNHIVGDHIVGKSFSVEWRDKTTEGETLYIWPKVMQFLIKLFYLGFFLKTNISPRTELGCSYWKLVALAVHEYLTCTVDTFIILEPSYKSYFKILLQRKLIFVDNITCLCVLCTFPLIMAEDFSLASTIPQETERKMQSETWNSDASSCSWPGVVFSM